MWISQEGIAASIWGVSRKAKITSNQLIEASYKNDSHET